MTWGKGLSNLYPERTKIMLKYDTGWINGGTSDFVYTLRGNSVYDPDYSQAGHYTLFHRTLSFLYNKYVVVASKVKWWVVNRGVGSLITDLILWPGIETTGTIGNNLLYNKETQNAVTTTLAEKSSAVATASFSDDIKKKAVLTMFRKTNHVLGLKGDIFNNSDVDASVVGSPTTIWYWNIRSSSVGGAGTLDFQIRALVKYYVIYFDRQIWREAQTEANSTTMETFVPPNTRLELPVAD